MNFSWKKLILFLIIITTLSYAGPIKAQSGLGSYSAGQTDYSSMFDSVIQGVANFIEGIDHSNNQTIDKYNQYIDSISQQIGNLDNLIESGQMTPEELQQANDQLSKLHNELNWATSARDNVVASTQQTTGQARKEIADAAKSNYTCNFFSDGFSVTNCGFAIMSWALTIVLWIISWILYLASWIFNESVKFSILDFYTYAQSSGVAAAWKIARDLANIFFIFILLYVAIKTVLGEGGAQKLVAKVIIMALLVNFSAVIPRVVIDASNILALQFYNSIGDGEKHDISATIMNWNIIGAQSLGAEPTSQTSNIPDLPSSLIQSVGIAILMITLAFVLIVAAVMFLYRTIALLFIIIVSPVAVMSWALPKYSGQGDKWLSKLISESLYAPAYLFLLYMVVQIFKNTDRSINSGLSTQIIFFILMNSMLLACVSVANFFGAEGSKKAEGIGKSFRGFFTGAAAGIAGTAGVYTLGRTAQKIAESDRFKDLDKKWYGRAIKNIGLDKGLKAVSSGKYGSSSNYNERVERNADRITQWKNPEDQLNYLTSLNSTDQKAAWKKLSDRQKTLLQQNVNHLDDKNSKKKIITDLIKGMSIEEQEKMDKALGDAVKQKSEAVDRFNAGRAVEFFTKGKVREIKEFHKNPDGSDDESRPIYKTTPDGKDIYEDFDINVPGADTKVKKYLAKVKDNQSTQLSKSLKFNTSDEKKLSNLILRELTPGQVIKLLGDANLDNSQYANITSFIINNPGSTLSRVVKKVPEIGAKFLP